MDIHNDPIDYAVAVADDRARRLLRERGLRLKPGSARSAADRQSGWPLRIVAAEPLIVGAAGFLLGWLVSRGG